MKKSYMSISLCALLLGNLSLLAEDNENTKELQSITVVEKTSSNYLPEDNSNIVRTNISLEDTPKSVQIFNEQLIEDYQPQSINDIVELSSNTVFIGDNHGRENMFAIRGFSGVPVLRDGFNIDNAISYPEVYNLERIEVLKGPDSLQYGQSSPGGLINLVKKKPKKEFVNEIELELTSNSSYSPKIDLTGPINEDGSLKYRLVSVYKNDDSYKDYNFNEKRFFIAPTIEYDINDNHTLTFISEYLDETKHSDFGSFIKSNGELAADVKTVTSNPDEKLYKDQTILGFNLDSTFETWDSSFKYRFVDYDINNPSVHMPFGYIESSNTIVKYFATQRLQAKEHAFEYTLNKELNIADFKNNISIGADFKRSKYTYEGYVDLTTPYYLDLSNISYETLTSMSDHPNAYKYLDEDETTKKYGVFIQDSINLTNDFILSLGVRYDKVDPKTSSDKDAMLPQLGLVYKISPKTSLYANYSESFTPQTDVDINGDTLDPEEGKGFEIGLKQKLFDDNFDLTTALFKIEKNNVSMEDPTNTLYSIASGKQESKGIEIDLTGKLTENLSIVASYGYTNTEDKGTNSGKELAGIPRHSANIFTTYNLSSFSLPNAYVGAGIRYLGKRYANDTNTITLDSNMIYSLTTGYEKGNWKASIGIQNLTDEVYVQTARATRVTVGTPRAVVATVSYRF